MSEHWSNEEGDYLASLPTCLGSYYDCPESRSSCPNRFECKEYIDEELRENTISQHREGKP